jgi:hypothetical protein
MRIGGARATIKRLAAVKARIVNVVKSIFGWFVVFRAKHDTVFDFLLFARKHFVRVGAQNSAMMNCHFVSLLTGKSLDQRGSRD